VKTKIMDAENIHQVFDWLWTSGQLSESDIASLSSLGIEAVINLALPTSPNALPGEAELVTQQGISYTQIPVQWENPKLEQLTVFFGMLNALKDRKVWVHCAKNMRVSAFIYLYRRICLAENHEAAAFPMKQIWEPNEIWQGFIQSALRLYVDQSEGVLDN
jgi:protein tyrosine phosphatase (PTP) superfamily phosphohydrolase (DUF442 family)